MTNSPDVSALIQQSLAENRQVYLSVSSNSMAPIFREGDEIRITKVEMGELSPGKILALKKNNSYLAHRLLRIIDQGGQPLFITKGDRLWAPDRPHPLSDVLGLVVARRRAGQMLYFDRGKGRWLAWILAKVCLLEAQITNQPETDGQDQLSGKAIRPGKIQLFPKMIHWGVYRLALILLKLTRLLP